MSLWRPVIFVSLGMAAFHTPLLSQALADPSSPEPSQTATRRMRQPVALMLADGGKSLFVANRRSGSLSVIDTATRKVVSEYDVGRGLADLSGLRGGRYVLAIGQDSSHLLLIDTHNRLIRVVIRTAVSPDPVKLVVAADGSLCVVSSRWSRRLTFVGLANPASPDLSPALSILGTLDLPFCPRELALVADGSKLIVADAFGGKLAVIDTKGRVVDRLRSLPAHNIRGLAISPDNKSLLIAHQGLNRLAQASFDDVHWGLLVRNHLRVFPISQLLMPWSDADLLDRGQLFDLGDVGHGAGDPGCVRFDSRGNLIVALAGIDEIAIATSPAETLRRVIVGRRPTAIAPSLDGRWAYVADSLDDTVSVIDIAAGVRASVISLGPRPELTAVDRGERLFFSAKLSHDGWMSCQSCHTDGHTNGLLSDTLGDGSYGAPKRIPSLFDVAMTGPWTWLGSITRLEDQVRKSIATTMQNSKPTDAQVADLTAYLTSLALPTQEATGAKAVDALTVTRGREIFEKRQCASCHAPPEYTSPKRFNVGLTDEVGHQEFNPPSLRGVRLRDTLLHNARAKSLEDVFQKVRHPRGLELTAKEIADLVAFLRTL